MRTLPSLLRINSIRKLIFTTLLLIAGAGAGLAGTVYVLGTALKDRLQERWPAGLAAELQLRSIATNRHMLRAQGDRSDAIVRVQAVLIKTEISKQLAKLTDKKHPGKGSMELTVLSLNIDLQQQVLVPRIEFRVTKGNLSAHAEAMGFVAPTFNSNSLSLEIALKSLTLYSVKTGRWWDALIGVAIEPFNELLAESMVVLNAVLDREFNPINIPIDFGPLANTTLQDLTKEGDFRAADRTIRWDPALELPSILVEKEGVIIVAQVRNRTLIDRFVTVTVAPAQVSVSDASKLTQEYADYSKDVRDRAKSAFALSDDDLGKTLIVLSKRYVAQTLNKELETPVCGTYQFDKKFTPFSEVFTLGKPPEKFDCARDIQACLQKSVCDSKVQCRDKIEVIPAVTRAEPYIDDACVVAGCAAVGGLGCALGNVKERIRNGCRRVRDVVVAAERRITHLAEGAVCEAFRQLNNVSPQICQAADKLTAPECVALNSVPAAACTVRASALEYFAKNPLARLKGQVTVKGQVPGCARAIVSDQFDNAAFEINAAGKADAAVDIDFDPSLLLQALPVLGLPSTTALSCFAGFEKRFMGTVTTTLKDTVGAKIETERQGERLIIRFVLDKKNLSFDLDKSPIEIVFAKNPELLVKCSLLLTATVAYATWDSAVSKRLSPVLTGKNFKHEFEGLKFSIRVSALKVGDLKLTGTLNEKSVVFAN